MCGRAGDPGLRRFGHLFCSEAHVAQFAEERRAKPALAETSPTPSSAQGDGKTDKAMACEMRAKGGLRKMGWCFAGGMGLLLAIPLIAWGGAAATAGSLVSVLALLACPIGMYLMMRAMMKGQHGRHPNNKGDER
jgi:hypothetical protein